MAFDVRILTGSPVPIYRQVVDQVCHAVAAGALRPGDQLPSVRELAERLVLNPNTVARAYGQLVQEGVAESRQGKGVFVTERRQVYSDAERRRRLDAAVGRLVDEAVFLGVEAADVREALDRRLNALERPSSRGGGGTGAAANTTNPARRS
jgi:GntR family transcriptional regulator